MELKTANRQIKPIYDILPSLTHLICADDVLIFIKADINGAKAAKNFFQNIKKKIVGLQVNIGKTKIMFSKDFACKKEALNLLPFQDGELPIKYLGVPLSVQWIAR